MVYLLPDLQNETESDYAFFRKYLSEQRLEKSEKYRFFADKISSAYAYLLLRILLNESGLYQGAPTFSFDKNEKPYCAEVPGAFFSLAHDRAGVMAALDVRPIGCDVQKKVDFDSLFAKNVFSPYEEERMSEDKSDYLSRLWVMKESYGKLLGDGVFAHLTDTEFDCFDGERTVKNLYWNVSATDGLYYAVCAENKQKTEILTKDIFYEKVCKLPFSEEK